MGSDREMRIRQRAYEIWDRDGRLEGRADEHWRRAELEIMAEESAREVPQAGGPEEEPRIWNVARAAADGRPARTAIPPGNPAATASQAGRRGRGGSGSN